MTPPDELRNLIEPLLMSPHFRRAAFGGVRRGATIIPWNRVRIRRLDDRLQFEWFDDRKAVARTITPEQLPAALDELIAAGFSEMNLETTVEEVNARLSKRGRLLVSRSPATANRTLEPHNRKKALPISEGEANPLLAAMGILDRDGRVLPSRRDKFRQINEFLKNFLHVLDDSGLRGLGRPIRILDCGCGSSFLTLALHDYLNRTLHLPAEIIGVDVNDEVIRKSTVRAERLDADGVKFLCQSIDSVAARPDAVVSLHACDTATDSALAAAIRTEARLILCVPCCHQNLNAQLSASSIAELKPVLRHGILRERQADLFTDAFRALLLRMHGYRTDVVEFIDAGHTPRNLMIRAVRTAAGGTASFRTEYDQFKQFTGLTPHLETLLAAPQADAATPDRIAT